MHKQRLFKKKSGKSSVGYLESVRGGTRKEGVRRVKESNAFVERNNKERQVKGLIRTSFLLPNTTSIKHNPKREFDVYSKIKKINDSLPRGQKIPIPTTFRLIVSGANYKEKEHLANSTLSTKYDFLKRNELSNLGVFERDKINNEISRSAKALHDKGFVVMKSAFRIARKNGKLVPILVRFDRVLTEKEFKKIEGLNGNK